MELGTWIRMAWDRAAAVGLIALGAVVLLVGWVGVSGEVYPAKQLPFIISGGVGGMCIIGLGALFWLSADLRDEWTALDRIHEALTDLAGTDLVEPAGLERAASVAPAAPEPVNRLVVAPAASLS